MFFIIIAFIILLVMVLFFWRFYRLPDSEIIEKIFSESEIHSLEISSLGSKKILLVKPSPGPPKITHQVIKQTKDIISPEVGYFYIHFQTEDQPFVEVGKQINIGDDTCLIVSHLLHDAERIKSEVAGIVVEIKIEDGYPVEYGQVLMRIQTQ